jgi:hypothetical protein
MSISANTVIANSDQARRSNLTPVRALASDVRAGTCPLLRSMRPANLSGAVEPKLTAREPRAAEGERLMTEMSLRHCGAAARDRHQVTSWSDYWAKSRVHRAE